MSLVQYLVDRGVIQPDQATEAVKHQQTAGGSLSDALVSLRFVAGDELERLLQKPPSAPDTIEETGLDSQFLLHLLLKIQYMTGLERPSSLGEEMKLHPVIVGSILEDAKAKRLVSVLGTRGSVTGELRYELTDLGRQWALDSFSQSRYVGPAPVPLSIYQGQVMKQSIETEQVSREDLAGALSHLVLPAEAVRVLGPAVNSAKSILLFGPSGNGKTSVAEAITRAYHDCIYVPHCVEVDRQVITIFDAAVHEAVPAPNPAATDEPAIAHDPRWVRCRRPAVITGGELTLEMLDLIHDPVSNFYEAPAHIKATGGVFIVDDFGRQRVPPREILDRWILPLERRVDYLTLRTGKKLRMPFDQLVIFSTNMPPEELMDEASMRRVQYKIPLPAPSSEDYIEILRRICRAHGLDEPTTELTNYLLQVFYPNTGTNPSAYHPRFLVEHVIASCDYEGNPRKLSVELAREALLNLVVTDVPKSEL